MLENGANSGIVFGESPSLPGWSIGEHSYRRAAVAGRAAAGGHDAGFCAAADILDGNASGFKVLTWASGLQRGL